MKTKKIAIIGASGYSGEVLVQLLLNHPHAELVAVTSRQNAGQTLAQVFPKFASHPKSKTLRFTEPNAKVLAKQADIVFLALPHGVAAEYAVPLLNAGCVVIDLSADFRLKSAAIYKEFYAHDHPAPDLLKKSVYGLPEIYRERNQKIIAHRVAGLLPDQHLAAGDSAAQSRPHQTNRHHRRFLERRQRRGPKSRSGLSFLRMQRKRPALRRAEHRHLSEIEEQLSFAAKTQVTIQFTPHLIPVNRGILTTLYLAPENIIRAEMTRGKNFRVLQKSLRQGAIRPVARRQKFAGHKKCRRHERHRNRVAARPAHRPAHRDERRGQSGQGRERTGGAEHEHLMRLSGNGGIGLSCAVKGSPNQQNGTRRTTPRIPSCSKFGRVNSSPS